MYYFPVLFSNAMQNQSVMIMLRLMGYSCTLRVDLTSLQWWSYFLSHFLSLSISDGPRPNNVLGCHFTGMKYINVLPMCKKGRSSRTIILTKYVYFSLKRTKDNCF